MKISKTAWLILGIGFFVLASAVLVVLFFNQSGDAEKLEENIAANQILLTKLSSDSEVFNNQLIQLDNQLDEAEVAYNQSKANFPQVVISIEYDEELFLIADDCDLEVMSLIASEPRENEVEEWRRSPSTIPYSMWKYGVRCRIYCLLSTTWLTTCISTPPPWNW